MRKLNHISEIFNDYDTFVIDLWGVMHNGISLNLKAMEVIENLKLIGGLGGIIGLDQNKNVVMPFNTKGMFRGYISEKGEPVVMIYGEQN